MMAIVSFHERYRLINARQAVGISARSIPIPHGTTVWGPARNKATSEGLALTWVSARQGVELADRGESSSPGSRHPKYMQYSVAEKRGPANKGPSAICAQLITGYSASYMKQSSSHRVGN